VPLTCTTNQLLAALPHKERQRFVSGCEVVDLAYGEILSEPGGTVRQVYFPIQALISLLAPINNHASLEVGLVGDEGMLGASLFLGVDTWPLHAVVQGAGTSLRMDATRFRHELEAGGALQRILKRYLYVVIGQLAQTAACTHYHRLEARLARWLLMTGDRSHSEAFHVTHEFLAAMLGVRRVGVTKAASSLQARKLIAYRRGNVTILDRIGLEAASCTCYAADKSSYARTMARHQHCAGTGTGTGTGKP